MGHASCTEGRWPFCDQKMELCSSGWDKYLDQGSLQLLRLLSPSKNQVPAGVMHAQVVDVQACLEHGTQTLHPEAHRRYQGAYSPEEAGDKNLRHQATITNCACARVTGIFVQTRVLVYTRAQNCGKILATSVWWWYAGSVQYVSKTSNIIYCEDAENKISGIWLEFASSCIWRVRWSQLRRLRAAVCTGAASWTQCKQCGSGGQLCWRSSHWCPQEDDGLPLWHVPHLPLQLQAPAPVSPAFHGIGAVAIWGKSVTSAPGPEWSGRQSSILTPEGCEVSMVTVGLYSLTKGSPKLYDGMTLIWCLLSALLLQDDETLRTLHICLCVITDPPTAKTFRIQIKLFVYLLSMSKQYDASYFAVLMFSV